MDEINGDDAWLTLAEIAEELHLRPVTVRSWVSKGKLRAKRAGQRRSGSCAGPASRRCRWRSRLGCGGDAADPRSTGPTTSCDRWRRARRRMRGSTATSGTGWLRTTG